MNKSLMTNLIAGAIFAVGLGLGDTENAEVLTMVGLFALSGALTNWLAVFMLFEKVPFLYGSGVITQRFESFKNAMKNLIMNEFFTPE